MSPRARGLPLILVLTGLAGCSTSSPAGNHVAGTLVRPEQLTGQWQARDDRGTELAGGFCDLTSTVDSTAPVDQAVTVLVNGELLARDTRLRYDGTAQQAYDTLHTRLAACRADPDSARLRLTIEPLTVPSVAGGRSAGYRLPPARRHRPAARPRPLAARPDPGTDPAHPPTGPTTDHRAAERTDRHRAEELHRRLTPLHPSSADPDLPIAPG